MDDKSSLQIPFALNSGFPSTVMGNERRSLAYFPKRKLSDEFNIRLFKHALLQASVSAENLGKLNTCVLSLHEIWFLTGSTFLATLRAIPPATYAIPVVLSCDFLILFLLQPLPYEPLGGHYYVADLESLPENTSAVVRFLFFVDIFSWKTLHALFFRTDTSEENNHEL